MAASPKRLAAFLPEAAGTGAPEQEERNRFGEDGFERVVGAVADIEKRLGIYELAQFTP